jgi:hypothetical protein
MKKVVLTFGLISGLIIAVLVWVNTWLLASGHLSYDRAELTGYASMLIALSMVFFGIKSYRDNHAEGHITFWKGVQVGILISLISGVLYFAGAESYGIAHPGFVDNFVQRASEQTVNKMRAAGSSQEQIDKSVAEIDQMKGLLQNPLIFFFICLIEILPVGIVVTLISAALLRKKELLPAAV